MLARSMNVFLLEEMRDGKHEVGLLRSVRHHQVRHYNEIKVWPYFFG